MNVQETTEIRELTTAELEHVDGGSIFYSEDYGLFLATLLGGPLTGLLANTIGDRGYLMGRLR